MKLNKTLMIPTSGELYESVQVHPSH